MDYDDFARQRAEEKLQFLQSMMGAQNVGMGGTVNAAGLQNAANNSNITAAQLNQILSGQYTQTATPPRPPAFDPNEDPAYKPSLQAVTDMWALRFGTVWVNVDGFGKEDRMWERIAERLHDDRRIERAQRQSGNWVRLKDHHGNR